MSSSSRTNLDKSLDEIIQERSLSLDKHYPHQKSHHQETDNNNKWTHDLYENYRYENKNNRRREDRSFSSSSPSSSFRNPNYNSNIEKKRPFHKPPPFASLLVKNLYHEVSESDLKELFETIGSVKKVRIEYDKAGRSNGIAHIQFYKKSDAADALNRFNGVPLDGMALQISIEENRKFSSFSSNDIHNDRHY